MAHRGSRSRFLQVRAQKRAVSWSEGPTGTHSITANQSTLFTTGQQALVDLTVVRIRGELLLGLGAVDALLSGFPRIAFGLCNVTENAFNAGVTSIPTPLTDIAWDGWMYHWVGSLRAIANATLANAEGLTNMRLVVDTKAMRKMHATDVTCAVIETAGEVGTVTLAADLSSRMLDKPA